MQPFYPFISFLILLGTFQAQADVSCVGFDSKGNKIEITVTSGDKDSFYKFSSFSLNVENVVSANYYNNTEELSQYIFDELVFLDGIPQLIEQISTQYKEEWVKIQMIDKKTYENNFSTTHAFISYEFPELEVSTTKAHATCKL